MRRVITWLALLTAAFASGRLLRAQDANRPRNALEAMARQQAAAAEADAAAQAAAQPQRSGPVRYQLKFVYASELQTANQKSDWHSHAVDPQPAMTFKFPRDQAWEGDVECRIEVPESLEFAQPPAFAPNYIEPYDPSQGLQGLRRQNQDPNRPRDDVIRALTSRAAAGGLTHDAIFRMTCSGTSTQASVTGFDFDGPPTVELLPGFGMGVTSDLWIPAARAFLELREEGPGIESLDLSETLKGRHSNGWQRQDEVLPAAAQQELYRAYRLAGGDQFQPGDMPVHSLRRESIGKGEKFQATMVHEVKIAAGGGLFYTSPAALYVDSSQRGSDYEFNPANPTSSYTAVYLGNESADAGIRIRAHVGVGTGRAVELFLIYEIEDSAPAGILALDAIDANPQFFNGKLPETLTADDLLAGSPVRLGAAADGISQLIVRAQLGNSQPITFELFAGRGSLTPLFDGRTVAHGGGYYAYALYTPPERFGGGRSSKKPKSLLEPAAQPKQRLDDVLEYEPLMVGAIPAGQSNLSDQVQRLELKLVRPPVVLVHGLFSNPLNCWVKTKETGTSLVVLMERSGLMPFLVSYESSNGSDPDQKSSFRDHRLAVWDSPDTTAGSAIEFGWLTGENRGGWLGVEGEPPVLSEFQRPQAIRIGGIKQAVEYYRNTLQLAATQADVIGHSMGGLLARVYASESYNPTYRRPENYNRGDISRLITICTPHHGTELPSVKDVLLQARLETADGKEEDFVAWSRRVLYRTAVQWFLDPEPGAIRDLRSQSPALAEIGPTSVPSFAIATQFNEGQAATDNFDPYGLYFHTYSGLAMVFFYNPALMDEFVARRAQAWMDAGPQKIDADCAGAAGVAWGEPSSRAAFCDAFRAGLDHNVMFWIQRREGAYRERVRQAIDAQQVIPYGYLDYDLGESWLGDPWADLSRIFVGGDLTAMRRVDIEPDIPYELITMLRALIFHNDPRNDGAVRVLSQIGGLDQHVVLDGILHSFAPWHYAVQRQCIDLLKWEDGRFSPNGFGPAGQPLPVYQPLAAFRDDRLKGLEAIDWSGMVREHALAIAELADAEDLVVIYRPVNRDCTPLIAAHCATKNMLIKGKSSDWGPQRGYIPREQRFSKFWTQYQGHRATFDKKVHEYNEITEKMLAHTVYPPDDDPEAARWTGRKVAVARPLIVSAGGADYELWHDPEDPDCEAAIYLRPVGGQAYFDWRSGAGDGRDPTFDPAVAPTPKRPAPAPEVVQRLQPLEVLADGLADGDPKPYLTADYDLLAVAPRNSSDFFGEPAELKRLKQGKPHATRGYITREQLELVKQINQTVRQKANYQGGNVSHHGPENQYPDSPYVDYPLLVFDPGSPDRGDAEVFVVRQGPPGFRDLHLKRYFEEKIREHFNLYPNREGRGWQWESWRAFSMERGYDPRDAARLPPYVEESPRPAAR